VDARCEPPFGSFTALAAVKPELVSSAGSNASIRLSSALVIHISPLGSNATPNSVWSLALGVVSVVAGSRSPVPLSWVGSRRRMADGLALAVQRPSGTGGPGSGSGGGLDSVESEPQAAITASRKMSFARRAGRSIAVYLLKFARAVPQPTLRTPA